MTPSPASYVPSPGMGYGMGPSSVGQSPLTPGSLLGQSPMGNKNVLSAKVQTIRIFPSFKLMMVVTWIGPRPTLKFAFEKHTKIRVWLIKLELFEAFR